MPTFKNCTVFREDLIAIERRKTTIHLNKPIYSGFTILDVSKTLMYDFHYNYIKIKYPGENSKLLFTDTDSLLYRLKTNNIHTDMLENSSLFDFSDYSDSHPCFETLSQEEINKIKLQNKKRIGCFKDEVHGNKITEFVGLRAKVYAFKVNEHEIKKLKGIKKYVVARDIHFNHYKNCLVNRKQQKAEMNTFRSTKHQVQSVCVNKTSLSCYDDKRWLCPDGITTLAYGHYLTQN